MIHEDEKDGSFPVLLPSAYFAGHSCSLEDNILQLQILTKDTQAFIFPGHSQHWDTCANLSSLHTPLQHS